MHYPVTPIHGESVFSLISRAHLLSGNGSPFITLKDMTGHRGYKPLSGLPTSLGNIAAILKLPEGPTRLIRANTHFPLYAHFLTGDRQRLLVNAMLGNGAPKARLGLLRSNVSAREYRRYCPECERADISRHGVAIWRRAHSLPGVIVCADHNTTLLELKAAGKFGDRQLGLPKIEGGIGPPLSPDVHRALEFLASQVNFALEHQATTLIGGPTYHRLLNEAGLTTKNGRIQQRKVVELVREWLKPLRALPVFERLLAGTLAERSWVAELTDCDDGFHHPLKHMVLWGALSLDFECVRNTAAACGEQLNIELGVSRTCGLTRDLLLEVLQETGSCRKAAKCLGVDVATVITVMDMHGLPVKRRAKTISPARRNAIASEPDSTAATLVAKQHGVSVTTVNRIRRAKRGSIASANPSLRLFS